VNLGNTLIENPQLGQRRVMLLALIALLINPIANKGTTTIKSRNAGKLSIHSLRKYAASKITSAMPIPIRGTLIGYFNIRFSKNPIPS
jgi:hypothetical protein